MRYIAGTLPRSFRGGVSSRRSLEFYENSRSYVIYFFDKKQTSHPILLLHFYKLENRPLQTLRLLFLLFTNVGQPKKASCRPPSNAPQNHKASSSGASPPPHCRTCPSQPQPPPTAAPDMTVRGGSTDPEHETVPSTRGQKWNRPKTRSHEANEARISGPCPGPPLSLRPPLLLSLFSLFSFFYFPRPLISPPFPERPGFGIFPGPDPLPLRRDLKGPCTR